MTETVNAFALLNRNTGKYHPPKKSGVPKIWSLRKDVEYAHQSYLNDVGFAQHYWTRFPQYRKGMPMPMPDDLEIVEVEIKIK